jgi:hypothetical protein
MSEIQRWGWVVVCVALLATASAGRVDACPNCKEAVAAQPADVSRMANGYNMSVMFMIAVPFTLFGAGAFAVHRAVKSGVLPEM